MSKRKKLRTSGGGVHPLKAPKNPRLGDSDGPPQNSEWGSLCLSEESEGRLEPIPSAEQRTEEPVQTASSSHDEEAGYPSRLLGQPEEEPVPALLSQNSARRFVPQFAKPRKTVTRQAELREEDLGGGAPKISQETPPEPSAQQARSQLWEESLGLAPWEARELGAQTQVDSTHPEHRDQNPMTPVPGNGNPQPSASIDASPEWGTVPLASERASQDHLSEQGAKTTDGESREGCWVLGYHSQKGLLLSSDAEEESDQGALQETGAKGGAGADLPERHQEEGDGVLGPITQDPEPRSAAQGLSDPMQIPSKTGREAEQSCSSPRHSSLETVVITDVSTDPTEPEQRAPEVARPDEQASTRAPTCPRGKASDGGCSGSLLSYPTRKKATELGRQSPERDLEGFSLSLGALAPPVHREAVGGPSQETRACQDSIDAPADPTGWSEPPPGSADQAVLGESPAMEPDFLPDSQIRDALESPDFEASPAQLFPTGTRLDSCWPGTSPHADGGLLTELQLRTCVGIKACEAARMEDATDTVHGLVVELSNLNRLIMSTHRDLEAFKRLSYRKARLAGKAPAPYTSKGAGNLPPGQQSWRDL
ncbi:break repair meiotic recombinase recruitment factor 1 [Neomonachus schauinslandi]|uniref:Break repair meiotic recombinase recruitment factor 1 n=1 Tax=Neomonachus schauinslandi TaxID=29088 RepID=A0A8M1MD54_NEOSC|nr:break repair meiotic recombinase recruitment factor 1 [Neomonachus schauinslandi]